MTHFFLILTITITSASVNLNGFQRSPIVNTSVSVASAGPFYNRDGCEEAGKTWGQYANPTVPTDKLVKHYVCVPDIAERK